MPDKIGFGQGIGQCKAYEDYKHKQPSPMALETAFKRLGNTLFWPGAERRCDKFKCG